MRLGRLFLQQLRLAGCGSIACLGIAIPPILLRSGGFKRLDRNCPPYQREATAGTDTSC